MPWLSLLRYRAVWAYVLAGILAGPAWGVLDVGSIRSAGCR